MTAIDIRALSRVYEQGERHALRDVTLAVPPGEVHSLLGPNGAGKTTLCRILSTVLLPSSGTVTVLGHDVVEDTAAVKQSIGVVFGGDRGLYTRLSARQNLRFWASLYGLPRARRNHRVDELLERVGLSGRADEKVQTYSRGMKQRLHLARGMVSDPGVLILDEPTVGMDPLAAREFRTIVRDLRADGRTILMTTHDMAEAGALSDRVSFLDKGRVTLTETPERVGAVVSTLERVDVRTPLPAELLERITAIPGVERTSVPADGGLRVETSRPDATRAVMTTLIEEGITDLARGRPDLEEAYVHLMGDRGLSVDR
ncbi:ABC transporter ATP-binding protein [Streptomyces sp. bgisy091]|uniref:ABC transporter ATP-binding protein n=1 Tax=Streptomyces sp. bgisy091 TaxID=3413778 RepID=UPI003D71D90F